MEKQGKLTLEVRLNGIKEDEKTPKLAAYLLDSGGTLQKKLATVEDGRVQLDKSLERERENIIAFGPDLDEPKDLPREGLLQYRIQDAWPNWDKLKFVEIPRLRWIDWFPFFECVSGRVRKCFPWWLPRIAFPIPRREILSPPFVRRCVPICNAVVEIYERVCCCRRILNPDIFDLIRRLREIIELIPIPIPDPDPGPIGPDPLPPGPGPDPAPFALRPGDIDPATIASVNPLPEPPLRRGAIAGFDPQPDPPVARLQAGTIRAFNPQPDPPVARLRATARSLKLAEAEGAALLTGEMRERLVDDVSALQTLERTQAIDYILARPYLWIYICHCSSHKLGEVVLGPDGSFTFCWRRFPILIHRNCRRSYYYKVRQWQDNQWIYIYDGQARREYFDAGDFADLSTMFGRACRDDDPEIDNDRPFALLQEIGNTSSHLLNSHWLGRDVGGNDLTQTSENGLAALIANAGLAYPPSPLGASGASLYVNCPWATTLALRLLFHPGMKALGARYYRISIVECGNDGQPSPASTPQPLTNALSWQKFIFAGGEWQIQGESLGPNPVGSEVGLYKIPFHEDAIWLGGQYHGFWSTGSNNKKFLVYLEVFDNGGNRLTPAANGFDFLRRLENEGPGSTAKVGFAKLAHVFWVDNRPVYGDIEDLRKNGVASTDECQFMSGTASTKFSVGFRAYHFTVNSVSPPETFMYYYSMNWHRGLNGPTVTFETGGTNKPTTLGAGVPAESNQLNFSDMLGTTTVGSKCTFAVNLHVYAKHTNGSGRLSQFDRHDQAAFALEISS